MTFEIFIPKKFQAGKRKIIEQANAIIDEYVSLGFRLSLRQLFYQFVSRDLMPNVYAEYKKLGVTMLEARDARALRIGTP